jgi:transposase-like protein
VELSVIAIADRIQTEADAYTFMEQLRWGDNGPRCPHCDNERAYLLTPENGVSRKTRTGAASFRKVWKCASCRKQFSVTTGTIFHGSKISLRKWLFVVYEMCANKNGVAAREIERKYDVTNKTAWFMLHRIRYAMEAGPLSDMMRGTVVADETYIGGKFDKMHASKRKNYTAGRAGGPFDKTPVLSLISAETGEVRSRVLPRVDGANLRKAIAEQVDMPNTTLHTDKLSSYNVVGREVAAHHAVDHKAGEYVRGDVSTNKAENFFSQLKRSIDGTHHHVSTEHLPRYLAEFDYRYSTRELSDSARTRRLMGQVGGRRLTYKRIAGS